MSKLNISDDDIAYQSFPHRCAGGQQVSNVTPGVSAFHFPTGVGVICSSERSQGKNKVAARSLLETVLEWQAKCSAQQES